MYSRWISSVSAPGYDAATRGAGEAVTYDAAGRSVILLDGGFAVNFKDPDDLVKPWPLTIAVTSPAAIPATAAAARSARAAASAASQMPLPSAAAAYSS